MGFLYQVRCKEGVGELHEKDCERVTQNNCSHKNLYLLRFVIGISTIQNILVLSMEITHLMYQNVKIIIWP